MEEGLINLLICKISDMKLGNIPLITFSKKSKIYWSFLFRLLSKVQSLHVIVNYALYTFASWNLICLPEAESQLDCKKQWYHPKIIVVHKFRISLMKGRTKIFFNISEIQEQLRRNIFFFKKAILSFDFRFCKCIFWEKYGTQGD